MFLLLVYQHPNNLIYIRLYIIFHKTTQRLSQCLDLGEAGLYGLLAGELDIQRENLGLCGTAGLDSLVHCTANLEALPEQIWPRRLHIFLPGQTPSYSTGASAVMMRSSILLTRSYSMGQEIWLFNPLAAAHDYLARKAEKCRQPKV